MNLREEVFYKPPQYGSRQLLFVKYPSNLKDKMQYKYKEQWYYRDIEYYDYQILISNGRSLFTYEY